MAGEINGNDCFLQMEVDSVFVLIGSQISHTQSLSAGLIDVTNKSAGEGKRLVSGEGSLKESISTELLFSSDATFLLFRDAVGTGFVQKFRIIKSGFDPEIIFGIPTSFTETSPLEGALTSSIVISVGDDSTDIDVAISNPRLIEKVFGAIS